MCDSKKKILVFFLSPCCAIYCDTEVVRHLGSEFDRNKGSEIGRHLGSEVVRHCLGGSEVVRH